MLTAQREADETESIAADFLDQAAPARVVAEVVATAGRLDVLATNVGVMREAPLEEMGDEMWDRSLALNLTAPFLTIRAALPHLRETRGGIVNTGSIEGLEANPAHAAYCASKAGLHGLTRAVPVDAEPDGVRCNALAPG